MFEDGWFCMMQATMLRIRQAPKLITAVTRAVVGKTPDTRTGSKPRNGSCKKKVRATDGAPEARGRHFQIRDVGMIWEGRGGVDMQCSLKSRSWLVQIYLMERKRHLLGS